MGVPKVIAASIDSHNCTQSQISIFNANKSNLSKIFLIIPRYSNPIGGHLQRRSIIPFPTFLHMTLKVVDMM